MNKTCFRTSPLVAAAFVLALVVGLGGCGLPNLDAQDTRFYVLGTLPADTDRVDGLPSEPLIIDVASVTIPQYLQRPQIVTRVSANQLVLAEFDNWGGSLEKNMLRSFASNLAVLLATPEVHLAARRLPSGTDARVEVEVMQYERGPDGRVRLEAQWRLFDGDRERTALRSQVTSLESPQLPGADMQATVAAMTDLLGELSTLIARAIVEAKAP